MIKVLLVLSITVGIAVSGLPSVVAQSNSTIEGRVVNGTPSTTISGGLPVFLLILEGDVISQQFTTFTDADGVFIFSDVPVEPGSTYLVSLEYQQSVYQAEVNLEQSTFVELIVYESTPLQDTIVVLDDTLMVTPDENEAEVLHIRQVIRVQNSQLLTFVPSFEGESMEAMSFLRFSLPIGYYDLTVTSDLQGGQILPIDRGVGITTAVPPGIHPIVLSYRVPYQDNSNVVFEPLFPFGTQSLLILLREDSGNVLGSDLEERESVTVADQTFRVFQTVDIAPGERVTIGFTDLPKPPWTERMWDAIKTRWELSLIMPGFLAIALMGLLIYAWSLLRRRPEPLASEALIQNIQLQPQQLQWLEDIARLDDAYQRCDLPEDEYITQRQKLKRNLMTLAIKQTRYL